MKFKELKLKSLETLGINRLMSHFLKELARLIDKNLIFLRDQINFLSGDQTAVALNPLIVFGRFIVTLR